MQILPFLHRKMLLHSLSSITEVHWELYVLGRTEWRNVLILGNFWLPVLSLDLLSCLYTATIYVWTTNISFLCQSHIFEYRFLPYPLSHPFQILSQILLSIQIMQSSKYDTNVGKSWYFSLIFFHSLRLVESSFLPWKELDLQQFVYLWVTFLSWWHTFS